MASAVTDLLVGKLVTILENEGTAIAGVRDEIDKIKEEFLSMKAFLKDAEANKPKTAGEQLWVARITDLAHDVEDIVDEFLYQMYEKQTGSQLSRGLKAPSNLWFRHKIAKKLQSITEMIKAIPEMNQRYGVGLIGGATTSDEDSRKPGLSQAEYSFSIMEEELVGIEGKKQILMGWLMDGEQRQTVISVVGMGGSGKTTLAAKTFNNENVQRHFNCYAWITVSGTYDIADLFRSLIKALHKSTNEASPADLNAMNRPDLRDILVSYLESKRYLIVLDDVWDIEVWKELRVALLDKGLGSRIILTTRKGDIASSTFGVKSHVHHIQPLKKYEAWELFSKKAFSSNDDKACPPELESLARELVEKCEGLPLAIVALGGLMSSKNSPNEWNKVLMGLNWHLNNDSSLDPVKTLLLLSFSDLPSQLKHCFLYCSLLPEDYVIQRKRLIKLWVAEGFVEHENRVTPEEVAGGYLLQLCFRSMLQVVKRNGQGRPKRIKMHDLLRELALSISEKEKFGLVYDGREVMEDISTRRLSIHTNGGEMKSGPGMSKIRCLLVFTTEMSSLFFSNALLSRFKLLRTLDLENVQIVKLPDGVVYLFNLRYLNLAGCSLLQELPKSIGRLRNLQFLNIKGTKIESLPQGIIKLLNLRHLIMYHYYRENHCGYKFSSGTKAPSDICKLLKLQCLITIESDGDTVRRIGNLTQLTTIGISNLKESDEVDLWVSIKKLTLLQSLDLMASNEEEILPVKAECQPLPHLQKLYLTGRLQKVVPWFSSLYSLTCLQLHWSRLEDDVLPDIEQLPNLTTLYLINSYVGEELCFRRGFAKLVKLLLRNFGPLKKIAIEKGAMPNLRELCVDSCLKLKAVPLGLEFLSNLQTLLLETVPKELINSIRIGGEDRKNVQHIQQIRHQFQHSSKWFYENL